MEVRCWSHHRRPEDFDPELIWRSRLQALDDERSQALAEVVCQEFAGRKRPQRISRRVPPKKIQAEAAALIREAGGRILCAVLRRSMYERGYTRDQFEHALTIGKFPSRKDGDGVWWRLLPAEASGI